VNVNDPQDTVLLARFRGGWRWYPNPESRKKGSLRWAVPAVEHWTAAESPEAARRAFSKAGDA
jgi:hypothetical protein